MKPPPRDPRRFPQSRRLVVLGLVALAAIWTMQKRSRAPQVNAPDAGRKETRADGRRGTADDTVPGAVRSEIDSARRLLAENRAASGRTLDQLRQALRASPASVVSPAIREFLESRSDAATGLGLKLGPGGVFAQSPTLRVFLLDQLGQIDPAAAAVQARTLLNSMDSPDEWAVALRNCARGDGSPEGRAFVGRKLEAMLANEDWLRAPSAGFLEAFDVAVYLGGTDLIPSLAQIVRLKDNAAASHAAYLALDRLTIADAASTLANLQANPDLMAGREVTRANYFARADVRDASQKQIVEKYLLDPNLVPEELDRFAALYPNANFMISHNLLTQNSTPDHAWLAARDAEALRLLEQWSADPRFAPRQPQLRAIRQRLESFAARAGAR